MNQYYTEVIGSLVNVMKLNAQDNYEHVCFVPLFDIPHLAESGAWDENDIAVGIVLLATYLTHVRIDDESVLIALRNLIALLFLVETVREVSMPVFVFDNKPHPVTAPITRLFLALSAEENLFSRFGDNGLHETIIAYNSMLTDDVPPKLTTEGISCLKGVYLNCLDAIKDSKNSAVAVWH
ncbi:hypothetical protein [Providencia rettgeri]|uniref:hypothetical protein n=1 Tax=Providencia rettgeri TaxID=587 RepID=UPI00235E2CC9|nr:hypothetical protein [Providencia rettgeri]